MNGSKNDQKRRFWESLNKTLRTRWFSAREVLDLCVLSFRHDYSPHYQCISNSWTVWQIVFTQQQSLVVDASLQMSLANGQRGWNGQPEGMCEHRNATRNCIEFLGTIKRWNDNQALSIRMQRVKKILQTVHTQHDDQHT